MSTRQYARAVEAVAGYGYYPEEVADAFLEAAQDVRTASDGEGLAVVTIDGTPAAVLVPLDLVEYALRHGWAAR